VTRPERSFQRVLITGIGGSGGSYLAEHIVESHPEVEVHGLSRWHSTTRNNLARIIERVTVHEADLRDFGSTFAVLREVRPEAIFHLAAHANVRASFVTPSAVLAGRFSARTRLSLARSKALRAATICAFTAASCASARVTSRRTPVPLSSCCLAMPTSSCARTTSARRFA